MLWVTFSAQEPSAELLFLLGITGSCPCSTLSAHLFWLATTTSHPSPCSLPSTFPFQTFPIHLLDLPVSPVYAWKTAVCRATVNAATLPGACPPATKSTRPFLIHKTMVCTDRHQKRAIEAAYTLFFGTSKAGNLLLETPLLLHGRKDYFCLILWL